MMKRKRDTDRSLRALIRDAIERDGRTLPKIAAAAGLDRAQLWRYVTGRRDIATTPADGLIAALGLACKLVKQHAKKGGGR